MKLDFTTVCKQNKFLNKIVENMNDYLEDKKFQ